MRLIIYIFIFSHLSNLLNVFADVFKKDTPDSNSINWEKIKEKESNGLKKIIWKSYNNDDSYFQNTNNQEPSIKRVENKNSFEKQRSSKITQIESFIPLNNFLDQGKFQTQVEWKSSFDGGASGGIGQQNNSFRLDYGILNDMQFSAYFSEADDDLYNNINGERAQYHWQNYAFSLKKKLLDFDNSNLVFSLVSTVEYWRSSSGSEETKSIYNETDNSLGKDRFDNLIGSFSIPISKVFNDNLTFVLVPGISFLPEKMGSRTNRNNSYGSNFYLGFD